MKNFLQNPCLYQIMTIIFFANTVIMVDAYAFGLVNADIAKSLYRAIILLMTSTGGTGLLAIIKNKITTDSKNQ